MENLQWKKKHEPSAAYPMVNCSNNNSMSSTKQAYLYDAVIVGKDRADIRVTGTLLKSGTKSILVLETNNYIDGYDKSVNPSN